jgi:hypothetical protein
MCPGLHWYSLVIKFDAETEKLRHALHMRSPTRGHWADEELTRRQSHYRPKETGQIALVESLQAICKAGKSAIVHF